MGVLRFISMFFADPAHDMLIYHMPETQEWIAAAGVTVLILADSGYNGRFESHLLVPMKKPGDGTLLDEERWWNWQVGSERIIIERVNARIKRRFRLFGGYQLPVKSREDAMLALRIAVWLVNREIRNGHPMVRGRESE
jgi:hypothetical protein